ncbi:MORN repeat [Trypanosoma brucei equiperdum]|uniref:MORN repeat n=1 Tax=Trypanosoma brucei equiperdum TaxID=630700 RepID=A0A3L6LHL2_9TRYP|nr:MORN repeat [Trypanosoma brucei equiperdum]
MQRDADRMKRKKEEHRDEEEFGAFRFADGSMYEGKFCRRESNADGTAKSQFPSAHPPTTRNAQQQELPPPIPFHHGKGVFKDAGGLVYDGCWVEGDMTGEGLLRFPSGATYEGSMYANSFWGAGTYTWPDGSRYEGQWENNKMHGKGTYIDAKGKRWAGKFHHGQGVGLLAEVSL